MIKSQLGIDRLMKAAAINKQAMLALVEGYRPGMTGQDVGKIFLMNAYENGADWVLPGTIMCGAEKEGIFCTAYALLRDRVAFFLIPFSKILPASVITNIL